MVLRDKRLTDERPARRALFFSALLVLAACRSGPVTIRAGFLLDGTGGTQQDVVVTVVGERISSVERYQGGKVSYDLSRHTLLPGLIDAHVHISGYLTWRGRASSGSDNDPERLRRAGRAANARATLNAGFTTVASMGSATDADLKARIDRGSIPGPRILTSLEPVQRVSLSPDSLKAGVRALKAGGADFIKVFAADAVSEGGNPTFSAPQLEAVCGEARRLGLRSVVHAQSDSSIALAVAAGCNQIEHGFLASPEALRRLAAARIPFDPQCRLLLTNYIGRRASFEGFRGFDSAAFAYMAQLGPTLVAATRAAVSTPGLTLLYGSDATAGAHGENADDLICRVREGGQAPMDAIVSATSRNAHALGLGDVIGTIAPGYQADLIAVRGNPATEIEALGRVEFVMKGGKVYRKPPRGSSP